MGPQLLRAEYPRHMAVPSGREYLPEEAPMGNDACVVPADQSPVLILPTENSEVIRRLALKLEEYQRRLDPRRAPEKQMDTLCKIAVLSALLTDHRVVTWDLSRVLRAGYGPGFDPRAFDNACRVIADYYSTGGTRNRGGTGLPVLSPDTVRAI